MNVHRTDGHGDKAVYLLKTELDGLPSYDDLRRAGHAAIEALDVHWRVPVVLKPNVVWKTEPDSGIVTHAAFLGGMVDGIVAQGMSPRDIIVAEGGGIEESHDMAEYYESTGYASELAPRGVELRDLNQDRYIALTDMRRRVVKRFYVARTILHARHQGTLVNVPKMKTHNMATVTLCVKNMQGMLAPIRHRHLCTLYPRGESDDGRDLDYCLVDKPTRFYHKLADLYLAIRPHLHIVEGIVGRDGTGFNRGRNIPMGLVLAGRDGLAVDHVGAMLMGFEPMAVGCLRVAAERGIYDAEAPPAVQLWRDGAWQSGADWQSYRANPPFELLRRDDIVYDDDWS